MHAQYLNATYDFTDILEKYWLSDSYLVSLNSLLQIGSDRIQGKTWAPRNSKDLPRARKKTHARLKSLLLADVQVV